MTALALFISGVAGGVGIGVIGHLLRQGLELGDDGLVEMGGE